MDELGQNVHGKTKSLWSVILWAAGLALLFSVSLLVVSRSVSASEPLNFKVGGIWAQATNNMNSAKLRGKYNYEEGQTQDGKLTALESEEIVPNLWGQLASEVEIWEQKKKLAKLKAETRDLEKEPQDYGANDLERLRPIMQRMIQESLEALPSKTEAKPQEVRPLTWPKVLAIHGTKSLKCTLRLGNGQLVQLRAGESIGDLHIRQITRHQVIASQKNVRQVLNFD